jgi:hypothetical protein
MDTIEPRKPKRVQAPEGCSWYLTPGKVYDIFILHEVEYSEKLGHLFIIINDLGTETTTNEKKSYHLNCQDWIIIEREGDTWLDKMISKIKKYFKNHL